MTAPVSVHVNGLCVTYGGPDVLRDATLDVAAGSFHVLLGTSGCGKTTLLRALAGFECARRGSIRLGTAVVEDAGAPSKRVPPERRGVGIVFQDYALFPHLSVAANVGFGVGRDLRAQQHALAALAQVGMAEFADVMPDALSGGQQQRVALARALASEPRLLLLDEPFSNLDPGRRADLRMATRAVVRHRGVTALMVTHDADEALELADTLSVMEAGRILQTGTPTELYELPLSLEVARAVGEVQLLAAQALVDGSSAQCALGTVTLARSPAGAHLLVRPEMLRVCDDGVGAPAKVYERRFVGADVILTVVLGTGERLTARLRPWEVPARDTVHVTLRGSAVMLASCSD